MTNILDYASAFTIICVAISWLVKGISAFKAPNNEQNDRIDALEKRCDRYDTILEKDKNDIEEIKRVEHLILKTEFALLQHGIDGNNIEPMKKAQEDIQNYLIDK